METASTLAHVSRDDSNVRGGSPARQRRSDYANARTRLLFVDIVADVGGWVRGRPGGFHYHPERDRRATPVPGSLICPRLVSSCSRHSEEAQWPAKVVPLARGKRILFESSWIDTTHVWRISTNSPGYKTARGYHVGMSLGDLRDRGEKLHFDYEEGYIVVTLSSEQIAFTPDDSTAKAFLNRSPTAFDSLESLPHSARIKEFIVSGDCHR